MTHMASGLLGWYLLLKT